MNKTILAILATLLFSCEERQFNISELGLTPENFPYEIAINGFISNEHTRCQVTISKPVAITDSIGFIPIEDATVSLTDGTNTYPFGYMELDDYNNWQEGKYITLDSIQAIPGKAYTLKVTYNGKTYVATDTIPEISSVTFDMPFYRSVQYKEVNGKMEVALKDSGVVGLDCRIHNFGYNTACRYEYIEQRLIDSEKNYLSIYDRRNVYFCHKGSYSQGVFPTSVSSDGTGGNDNDSIEVIRIDFSDAYYAYLITTLNETQWASGTFSTSPGNVKTNVSEGGTGFFYAVHANRKRFKLIDLWNKAPYEAY